MLHGANGAQLDADKTIWHLEASAARDETLLQKMTARSRRLRADITRLEKKIADQASVRYAAAAAAAASRVLTRVLSSTAR